MFVMKIGTNEKIDAVLIGLIIAVSAIFANYYTGKSKG